MKKITSFCFLFLAILASSSLMAENNYGKVTAIKGMGEVTFTSATQNQTPVGPGVNLQPGDTIKVGNGSVVYIIVNGNPIRIKPNTTFTMPGQKEKKEKSFFGSLWNAFTPGKDRRPIKTPSNIAGTSDRDGRQAAPNRPIKNNKHIIKGNSSSYKGGVPDHIKKMDFGRKD